MLKEFRDFAVKGNVIDLAVGLAVGASFGKIVTSLVRDIVMPPVGMIMGGIDFSNLAITLKKATATSEAVYISYGVFLNTIIEFFIVAFSIFVVIKQINIFKKKEEKKPDKPVKISEDILLLREIRDALKKKK